jgi:hypothetical protein
MTSCLVGSSVAWAWAAVAMAARVMAASVAAATTARVNLDMGAHRSTDPVWMLDGRLAGAWPAGQPPPATGQLPSTPVARPAGALGEPDMGGPLLSFGDALGGQLLAQPGMLVVHVPPPPLAAGAVLNSPGAHGQVDPDLGRARRHWPGNAEHTSIKHPVLAA